MAVCSGYDDCHKCFLTNGEQSASLTDYWLIFKCPQLECGKRNTNRIVLSQSDRSSYSYNRVDACEVRVFGALSSGEIHLVALVSACQLATNHENTLVRKFSSNMVPPNLIFNKTRVQKVLIAKIVVFQ